MVIFLSLTLPLRPDLYIFTNDTLYELRPPTYPSTLGFYFFTETLYGRIRILYSCSLSTSIHDNALTLSNCGALGLYMDILRRRWIYWRYKQSQRWKKQKGGGGERRESGGDIYRGQVRVCYIDISDASVDCEGEGGREGEEGEEGKGCSNSPRPLLFGRIYHLLQFCYISAVFPVSVFSGQISLAAFLLL